MLGKKKKQYSITADNVNENYFRWQPQNYIDCHYF